MRSMTGFGEAQVELGGRTFSIAISVVNHRNCQVQVRSEHRDVALEERVRKFVRDSLRRGSVTVQIEALPGAALFDHDAVAQAWRELNDLAQKLDAPTPRLEDMLRFGQQRSTWDVEHLDELVTAVGEAVDQVIAAQEREGANTEAVFREGEANLRKFVGDVEAQSAGRAERWQERLEERLSIVLQERAEITPEQIISELAVYCDRIDIAEEVLRLKSHVDELARLIDVDDKEPLGKRLEFLLQEIGREINTTGAKANDAGLSKLVMGAKGMMEQMREQAANVW